MRVVLEAMSSVSHSERQAIASSLVELYPPDEVHVIRLTVKIMLGLHGTDDRYRAWVTVGGWLFGIQPDSIRRRWSKVSDTDAQLTKVFGFSSPDSVTTTTRDLVVTQSGPETGEVDPAIKKLADAIAAHPKIAAAFDDHNRAAEDLFSRWPAFKSIDLAIEALFEAEMDTPAGEYPAETRRRVRNYLWGATKRRARAAPPPAEEPPEMTPERLAELKRMHRSR